MALMEPIYTEIKAKKRRFRIQFLTKLVKLFDRDQLNLNSPPIEIDFAKFLVENLVYLDYGVIEEVFVVIDQIYKIQSSTGISILEAAEGRETNETLATLTQRAIAMSLLIGLKDNLKSAYGLTEAKCRAFNPNKVGGAKDNKVAMRVRSLGIVEFPDIPYLDKPIQEESQAREQLQAVYLLLSSVLIIVCGVDASR